jgi:hypothetical protein
MAVQVIDGSVIRIFCLRIQMRCNIRDLDRHTDISTHPYSQTEEPHYTTIDDMDRIFAEIH